MKARPRKKQPKQPELFLNRELSWLAFNHRVLEEALDPANPLLERLKFATIAASNLDEFFMVRVAAIKHAVEEGDLTPDHAGLSPERQLTLISERAHEMVARLYEAVSKEILPALAERGIRIVGHDQLEHTLHAALARHFRDEVLPALTPLAIDTARPFPMLSSLSINLALLLEPAEGEEQPRLAVVQVPGKLRRLVRPLGADATIYVFLEDVIRAELSSLFPGQKVLEAAAFRIARDAEMELDDEGGGDYLLAIEDELRKRRRGQTVRLEVEDRVSDSLLSLLSRQVEASPDDVYRIKGPLDIRSLFQLVELPALEDLRDTPLKPLATPLLSEHDDLFAVLEQRDVLLHHPYESFDPVISLVTRAADDPDVLAIKQTLYRTSGDSPVVRALARAADAGKQVTVLVELMARFDEQSNIRWARSLEESGAHVIYGIRGLKAHAKICMVVRRTRQGIRRYVHLGTGNYNDRTARLYTDFGLMTSDRAIGEDASTFFNAITGYSDPPRMKKLAMAPTGLRERFLALIDRERRRAEAGQAAEMRVKLNSLVDEEMIHALYAASNAGVKIKLNIRGICCLRPGVKGASENIEVVSIIDRFLEHARIFYFRNGGDEELYLASADWMTRNLDKRVELLFPIESPDCRARVLQALDAMFQDNVKSRVLQADGSYKRRRAAKGEEPFRAQLELYRQAKAALDRARAVTGVTLEPVSAPAEKI